ncbi:MAG: segregation/condensation protein A [Acidobacteriota bacterium]
MLTAADDYTIQLEIFEGPLDLLLHLIRKQEIDIYDIPIAKITDQYLRYVQVMKDLDITVAGEFVAMAATLIHIKSQLLLPSDPTTVEEEEDDPRQQLVQQLLEHERFQKAADMLYELETVELSVWPRGESEFDEEEQEAVSATLYDMIHAFHEVVERYKEQIVLEVEHDPVTVEEKIAEIRRLLKVQQEVLFSFFLRHKLSRLHLAVTLVALLELARLREIRLSQKGVFKDIRILAC